MPPVDVIELLQVAGPILLGLAGMASGWGIARHQSQRAVEAEARQRAFVACSDLLAAAQQVKYGVLLWDAYGHIGRDFPPHLAAPSTVHSQANAAAAGCLLVGNARLGALANDLLRVITHGLVHVEVGGSSEQGDETLRELQEAIADFSIAARFVLDERGGLRWWRGRGSKIRPEVWDQITNPEQKNTPTSGEGAS